MAESLVTYGRDGAVATIAMDDGKRNALSPRVFEELNAALDRAESEGAGVLLTGRPDVFAAGFDLKVLRRGGKEAFGMLHAGYSLTERLLSFPTPVVAASSGHALAMGAFLLLSVDYRIGAAGEYKYAANEVAIGLPVPHVPTELMRLRLAPTHLQRAAALAETFSPEDAVAAGFLDEIAPPNELQTRAHAKATALMELDMEAHAVTKRRVRAHTLKKIRRGLRTDMRDAVLLGLRQLTRSK